jgi:hypothetical protein
MGSAKAIIIGMIEGYNQNIGTDAEKETLTELREELEKIENQDSKKFIEEAITCYENGIYRGSIILSWIGALYLLYSTVKDFHLQAFNAELSKRFSDIKPIKEFDDFNRIKESVFLEIIMKISVIDLNQYNELDNCLKLRNTCSHTNTFIASKLTVARHLEMLLYNIYKKY